MSWDRKLDGRLAGMLMSIPAVKGVEIGLGFDDLERADLPTQRGLRDVKAVGGAALAAAAAVDALGRLVTGYQRVAFRSVAVL